ncbi:exodeoxyribonuclease V subunit gamma [Pseudomonas chlororaphis]|uniref:exodeoxyribonuclease V subunit gamma n=1 Tax=Pseudomonas chlororaphis TaxID=587753 RepID=UPI0006A57BEF|nr:exodeoxyribonuclease V subunit gamma [Pseudomonas chlororaphis]AZC99966.1 Exodeoxyribonuclease V gamma chain [Pseudomonas chlororaphis subsp. chlororaphis]MBM0282050.1 exodeoxyribonuclease V subunit gamma [Pseudomonas chlororaphis]MDO1504443.1 exodeoxyribonuclease V subunit gamma [Pseudomonas chlororaphis]ORM49484.1 exodeoxyribonuclease V subunit gamma [Pseudomonas chlororaphis subsp. chlororaphis]TWR94415.1 exodeoxyribonuclease V subunit gamma [Pseudomonas chlororaphis subsp. chlororaphis]
MPDATSLSAGFMVVHGNRLDELRSLVVSWMRRYPLAPLENEIALVQSNGIAQWLKLALAEDSEDDDMGGCGIAAAIDVQLPGSFMWQLYRMVLGRDEIPPKSLLDKAPLTWRLMRLLPELIDQPHFEPLRRFLTHDTDLRKRYQLAERLADLFDQYQVYRADWLEDWAAGRHQLRSARGEPKALTPANCWQAELWRALLLDVGEEGMAQSRAGVHQRFIERILNLETAPQGLPSRVIVFGISSLPAQALEALAGLARFSQVLLCVHNPCRHHWADIVADKDLLRHQYKRQARKAGMPAVLDPQTLHQHAHPLLAAWGKQGRDYINLLDSYDDPNSYRSAFRDGRIDLFSESQPQTLLNQLQDDILELRPLEETRQLWPAVDLHQDKSIRFHIAHSAQREVEILHDQLLARFSEDPELRPRDVIVMVPDIDSYAPHIRAVFGQLERDDRRFIPFTLTDQGQRGRDPLLIAVEHLLKLPDSRFPVSEILDLLDVPALRARFGVDEADLSTLHRWIEGAGIRWGMNAEQRADLGLPEELEQNSWRFGLRRMLLGYAVGRSDACEGIEPYDEIGGLDAALIGPLVALLDALEMAYQNLTLPASPPQWGERLQALTQQFFLASTEHDDYLLSQLEDLRETWLETCESVGLHDELPLTVVREAWLAGLDQGRLSQRFLAGAVNFCTLMPMRAIPFKLVCLLGMNDGDYPRAQPPLDFDLMGSDYRPGDRSRREDDRYLLLEALLSARDQLYVSWVGRSIRDNSERPASVLIGQLRDHLASGWKLANDQDNLLDAMTQEHPLQPFSARYFHEGHGLFSYAREWQLLHQTQAAPQALELLAPYVQEEPLSLGQLQDFLRNPVRHFFSQRLKVFFEAADAPLADEEPFVLDALQRYSLSDSLLEAALNCADDPEQALQAQAQRLQASGLLPMAGFGESLQRELIEPLPDLLMRYRQLLELWPTPVTSALPITLELKEVKLEGWLSGLHQRSDGGLLSVTTIPNSIGSPKTRKWHRLTRPWVNHLVACASGYTLTTALVASDDTLLLPPLDRDAALQSLGDLLLAWQAGMCQPLPVAVKTAFAWLGQSDPGKAEAAARKAYEGDGQTSDGERRESPALARQYPDYNALIADETFSGWVDALYRPLLQAPWRSAANGEADV